MNDEQHLALRAWFNSVPIEIRDDWADFDGYQGLDSLSEIRSVVDGVTGLWGWGADGAGSPLGLADLCVSYLGNGDGVIDAFQIEAPITVNGWTYYLGKFVDWKDMTYNRDATGLDAAWHYLYAIAEHYLEVAAAAEALTP
jgi:hypothetical protein